MLNSEFQLTSDKVIGLERKRRNASAHTTGVIAAKKSRRGRKEEKERIWVEHGPDGSWSPRRSL